MDQESQRNQNGQPVEVFRRAAENDREAVLLRLGREVAWVVRSQDL